MLANKLRVGGSGGGLEITYVSSRTSSTATNLIALPSGTQVGDIVISLTGTINANYNPTGWTTAFFYNSTFEINCMYKIMEASDISSQFVQLATTTNNTWTSMQLHTFRPSIPITSSYVNDSNAFNASVDGSSISITPTEQSPPHIILGGNLFYSSNTPNLAGTFWDGKTNTTGSNNLIRMQFAYEIQPDYSTTRAVTQQGIGASNYSELGACYLSFE
jgi:hypothetical protein